MNFLSPLALLMATLSVPLLLLYFLKVRRRQVRVSSLLLWDPSLRDREASTFFQRLQRDPLLILQILALLALTVALARPAVSVMGQGAKRVAIVMDSSASMKAADVPGSRFIQAQRAALGLLGQLGEGAEVMVIEAGVQPKVLVPFTREHDRVASAIRSMEAHDLPNAVAGRPQLAGNALRHDRHACLRRALSRREATPAHEVEAEHGEILGRHGHLLDRHPALQHRGFDEPTRRAR